MDRQKKRKKEVKKKTVNWWATNYQRKNSWFNMVFVCVGVSLIFKLDLATTFLFGTTIAQRYGETPGGRPPSSQPPPPLYYCFFLFLKHCLSCVHVHKPLAKDHSSKAISHWFLRWLQKRSSPYIMSSRITAGLRYFTAPLKATVQVLIAARKH